MDSIIGFIGVGNMGEALISGIINSGMGKPGKVIASDISAAALEKIRSKYGISTADTNIEVAEKADILFLAVKPACFPEVIEQIGDYIKEDAVIVSIAAGQSIDNIENLFGRPMKLVRTMPNTPALVNEGMAAICHTSRVSVEETNTVLDIFRSIGKAEIISESLMDVVTAISGSSPAYVYIFIEAMADAAVADGMPRQQAYSFAAQAVLGAAKMVIETGDHPGLLKDKVCSPGGTTIEAVCELENNGFRNSIISAVRKCTEKSKRMQ